MRATCEITKTIIEGRSRVRESLLTEAACRYESWSAAANLSVLSHFHVSSPLRMHTSRRRCPFLIRWAIFGVWFGIIPSPRSSCSTKTDETATIHPSVRRVAHNQYETDRQRERERRNDNDLSIGKMKCREPV